MMVNTKLERLDNLTRSRIRSTQIVTSLPQIISELVQNSLDAGAKSIEVAVHCSEWTCWVRDDGCGINKDDLALVAQGIEGGRYASSKSYSPASLRELSTFGFRGEAIASAADLSCIEISSRTERSKDTWSVLLKGGEKLYYGPSLRWRRERAGTSVSIRDAFYNLPIRRMSHPNPARTLDLVRRELETFALVFPHITFSLRDLSKENNEGIDRSRVLTVPKTSSSLSTFRHLYGRALVEHVDTVDVAFGSMRIEGFLSLVGSPSRSYQFLYLNRHILDTCDLHRTIDKCFSSSTFAKHALDESGESGSSCRNARLSPKKGKNRPVYVLNLSVPPREVDNCLEPAKASVHFQNQDAVASFLADVIQSFLTRHGFKTARCNSSCNDFPLLSRKRKRVNASEDECPESARDPRPTTSTSIPAIRNRAAAEDLFIQGPSPDKQEEELTWVDPVTGRTYLVDPRTGNSYIRDHRSEDLDNSGSHPRAARRTLVDTRCLHSCQSTSRGVHGDEGGMPDWIRQALESNDVFASTERPVPCLPTSKAIGEEADTGRRLSWTKQFNEAFSASVQPISNLGTIPNCPLSKECLAGAEVLGQVDQKFIACLIDMPRDDEAPDQSLEETRSHRAIVLVDQHAADERVRVERYLKSLCLGYLDRDGVGVARRLLDPVPVLLTKFERDRLMTSPRIRKAFQDWGFDIVDVRSPDGNHNGDENDEGYGMIRCSSVPEIVADKVLSGSGSDLREFFKGYLARLEAEYVNESSTSTEQTNPYEEGADDFSWLKALRYCPRELIDLINSRACRGAIMFNDQLSVEQCRRLLRQLSMTAFPFQCAHGRPSIVPLTTIDSRHGTEERSRAVDWLKLA